jgi:transcription termination/antitermination protein NusG
VYGLARGSWFAVQVTPQHERKVALLLEYKGYEQFLPLYAVRRKWADRIKLIEQPLFPGYIFCRVNGPVVGLVRTTPGVVRIVGVGAQPVPVPDNEIDAIYRVLESRWDVCPYTARLEIGQKVLVKQGPLSGIVGKLLRIKGRNRLIICVDLIMKGISVDIDIADVSPIGPGMKAGNGLAGETSVVAEAS